MQNLTLLTKYYITSNVLVVVNRFFLAEYIIYES